MKNKNLEIERVGREIREYAKIVDEFPDTNIKTNAIKYLYYKAKPGIYMLPYFQEEEEQPERIEEKSKLAIFFFKKSENDVKEKFISFETYKNDQEFEEVRKKIDGMF